MHFLFSVSSQFVSNSIKLTTNCSEYKKKSCTLPFSLDAHIAVYIHLPLGEGLGPCVGDFSGCLCLCVCNS